MSLFCIYVSPSLEHRIDEIKIPSNAEQDTFFFQDDNDPSAELLLAIYPVNHEAS